MCFSKASLLGARPCLLVERKQTYEPNRTREGGYVGVDNRMEKLTLE